MLDTIDHFLKRLSRPKLWMVTTTSIFAVGIIDYLTGYEISVALFYQIPVGIAAWYGGRAMGGIMVLLASGNVLLADLASGLEHTHPAILIWNTWIHTGTFLITATLLIALRTSITKQEALARTDGLTGLYNRRAFEERFEHDNALAQRRARPLTIAYVDLDNFKQIIDKHGHAEGDRVLQIVAGVMRSSVRRADMVARLGGDEFALILPETDNAEARNMISKMQRNLAHSLKKEAPGITCSIGVITVLDDKHSADALLAADKLMYEVKRKGKNAVAFLEFTSVVSALL